MLIAAAYKSHLELDSSISVVNLAVFLFGILSTNHAKTYAEKMSDKLKLTL